MAIGRRAAGSVKSATGAIALIATVSLTGCAGTNAARDLPRGQGAYAAIPARDNGERVEDYRIGPLDTIDLTVFQEPDLSARAVPVDASGAIAVALIGRVEAAGRTATELSADIERRLGERYLVRPQVTVTVTGSVSQKVIVQGEVTEPGVYQIRGTTTLLEALSLAKGETRVAALKEVVVFRTTAGQRTGAVFDVARIRRGEAADPAILGNDTVVVGYSNSRGLWRDALTAAPILAIFRPF